MTSIPSPPASRWSFQGTPTNPALIDSVVFSTLTPAASVLADFAFLQFRHPDPRQTLQLGPVDEPRLARRPVQQVERMGRRGRKRTPEHRTDGCDPSTVGDEDGLGARRRGVPAAFFAPSSLNGLLARSCERQTIGTWNPLRTRNAGAIVGPALKFLHVTHLQARSHC